MTAETPDTRIQLEDLTVAQVEAIEVRSEVSFDQWTSPKASKAAVYGSMLVELGGADPKEVADMTIGDLVQRVKALMDGVAE